MRFCMIFRFCLFTEHKHSCASILMCRWLEQDSVIDAERFLFFYTNLYLFCSKNSSCLKIFYLGCVFFPQKSGVSTNFPKTPPETCETTHLLGRHKQGMDSSMFGPGRFCVQNVWGTWMDNRAVITMGESGVSWH